MPRDVNKLKKVRKTNTVGNPIINMDCLNINGSNYRLQEAKELSALLRTLIFSGTRIGVKATKKTDENQEAKANSEISDNSKPFCCLSKVDYTFLSLLIP